MTAGRGQEVRGFIGSTFRSVWAIELLCALAEQPERNWMPRELVEALRASEFAVSQSTEALLAAGLVVINSDASVRYQPISRELGLLAKDSIDLYRRSPDAVRRVIISDAAKGVSAFADAFKLRGE